MVRCNPSRVRAALCGVLIVATFVLAHEMGVTVTRAPETPAGAEQPVAVSSPNGAVRCDVTGGASSRLSYRVSFQDKSVIETSALGIIVDNVDLGQGVALGKVERDQIKEKFSWHGVPASVNSHCHCAKIHLTHAKTKLNYFVEVRAFDDGVAFRHVVPGDGKTRVPDEATSFVIPAKSHVWYHDFEGHYEGVHVKKEISEVPTGEWAAPPLTILLPGELGYAAITEAALVNYSGMALQAGGQRVIDARLGHAAPVSYPFRLRYGLDEAKRLAQPAALAGTITTPWRVVMIGRDLNLLVNNAIIPSVSPPPDRKLFPKGSQTAWIKPGRSVWKYLDGGESTLAGMKEFSKLAGQLGFEYNLVEGFWQRWAEQQLRELVEYSKDQRVGIWLWKHSKHIRDAAQRRAFFKMCHELGVVGVKLDFFDHEAKEMIDLYQAALKDAAEFQLLVDFHGANKPAGEARTWPNEMTREGIYGLEHKRITAWARHNTTVPFTRLLAGHADYTPVHFGERRKETSWAHQIASAAIITSPLQIYGAHPRSLLDNPAAEMIKSIPSVWDETVALSECAIGERAVFARRRGDTWFLAVMNGPSAATIKVPLSFLGKGKHQALTVRDDMDKADAVRIDRAKTTRDDVLAIALRAGGGFVARFVVDASSRDR
jgi:alpha-glucosidase